MGIICTKFCGSCLGEEAVKEISYEKKKKNEILSYISNENFEINQKDNHNNEYNQNLTSKEDIIDKKKLYGFYNPQNDCFMNASLQIFTHIEELTNFVKNFCINHDIKNSPLIREYNNIIKSIEEGKENEAINGSLVKEEIGKLDERFKTNEQQDASEFISLFIGKLLEETQGTADIKSLEEELKGLNELEKEGFSRLYKRFFLKKGKSYIVDLFYGILKVETRNIKDDKLISVSFSMFNILELPIYYLVKNSNANILSLENIFFSFFKDKKYNEDQKTYSINSIMKLPKYLLILFKRSVDEDYLDINIIYNKIIEMKNYLFLRKNMNIANSIYSLENIIEHSGNAKFGHYTAICKISEQKWYRFSDSYYTLNINQYKSNDAMILIYKNSSIN